jgi:DNA polymerase-1
MQVHDELVLEVPSEELACIQAHLPHLMANVAPFKVPLLAQLGHGEHWGDAH